MRNIIFFDGYCILCNGFVDTLIKLDRKDQLKFASLQGSTAGKTLDPKLIEQQNTVVFYKNSHTIFTESAAVIESAATLGGKWKAVICFKIFPYSLLNYIYRFIANHRFKWFGRRESCRIPTEKEKIKILP